MPITKTTGFIASDGVVYPEYEKAVRAELLKLFTPCAGAELTPEICVDWVLNNKNNVVEWLTTTPTSRLGARKRAGTTNPKRAATKAQARAGFKAMRDAANGPGDITLLDHSQQQGTDVPAEAVEAH